LAAALGPRDWVFGYAVTEFDSPGDQGATLAFCADDGIRLWLNGERVAESEETRPYSQALPDRVLVRLRAGRNRLVAKITNYTQGWGFGAGFMGNVAGLKP
jgi:hypothetical protein